MKHNTALITGGAKRIGRKIALLLASRGYDLVISYNKSKQEAKELAAEISKKFQVKCDIFQADLRDEKQAKRLAEFVKINSANWSLLINNASIFTKSNFLTAPDSELSDNLNLHFISPLILAKEFAKNSPKNGQIINITDKNIARYDTSYFYYLLSKKSLAELTKMLALELAPSIRVNAIAPGFILDPIDHSETQNFIQKIPLQKKGETQNILQAVDFLLNNHFVTGQILFIDGGASLNHAG
ncbi:MAG: SDR family oxidoreductase [Alphaproteobacteria bacterium]|nr:SDR family oxidoreductase [Alphaproteobacteria bacterium]